MYRDAQGHCHKKNGQFTTCSGRNRAGGAGVRMGAHEDLLWKSMGTLAHNQAFTAREMAEYTGVPIHKVRTFLKRLEKTSMIEVVEHAPVKYYPTSVGWERVEAESR